MGTRSFWRWYDRAARLDFAGTVLGYFFDWRSWLIGTSGGAMTFIWAAIDGRSPLDVWLMALMATACMVVISTCAMALWQKASFKRLVTAPTARTLENTVQDKTPAGLTNIGQLTPDWPIQGLFFYINPDVLNRNRDGDLWDEIANGLKDKFSLGQLEVWGRPVDGLGKMLGGRPALRRIDATYWHSAHFTYHFFDSTAEDAPHTYVDRLSNLPEYTDLRVNRAAAILVWPKQIKDSLQIIIGSGGEFETKQSAGLYKTMHTFNVCVRNGHPENFLSNCKFYLNIADPKDASRKDYLLAGPFTLNATEEKYVSIVSFHEPATIGQHSGDFIQLHVPVGWGYSVGMGWPWRIPVGAYTLALWAISRETGRSEVVCKFWVDDQKKLHFEQA
jgi:hypothetical protein